MKRVLIIIGMVMCLFAVGIGYAATGTAMQTDGEIQCEFLDAISTDNETDKNVGKCLAEVEDSDGDGYNERLTITIGNAYPGYEAHIDFTISNPHAEGGTVESLEITNPNPAEAIELSVTDLTGAPIAAWGTVGGTVAIGVGDGAQPNQVYAFRIEVTVVQNPS